MRVRSVVTALVTAFLLVPGGAAQATSSTVTWDPLARQEAEPDTLFLLDADAERTLAAGDGGLIAGDAATGGQLWTATSKMVPVAGRYRAGLRSAARDRGLAWMPSIGLIAPDEFTVEMWLKSDLPWAEVVDNVPFSVSDQSKANVLRLRVNGGRLTLTWSHLQNATGPVSGEISKSLTKFPQPADQWVNVAFTLKAGVLTLYLNGTQVGQKSGLAAPRVWSDSSNGDGLSLLGEAGKGADRFALSDLRISHRARTPGQPVTVSDAGALTVSAAQATGAVVNENLLGTLHGLVGPGPERIIDGAVKVLRTDKMLTATPIKAGQPDGAHPSLGVSGRYSYDWQVVDRSLAYMERLGTAAYISIDSTPQLLGGSVPPMSGTDLTTKRSADSAFAPEVPNDLEAFGTMVQDLVHHVVREQGVSVPYWGVWNEPDIGGFWKGTRAQWFRLYDVAARAVKAVDATLRVGGPDLTKWDPAWMDAFFRHCAAQPVPLDFVSWHNYDSTVVAIPFARARATLLAARYGLPNPQTIIGESAWQRANLPKTGNAPWRTRQYYVNDWHAALTAANLIEMQDAGVVYSIYTKALAESTAGGWNATGLVSSTAPWANLNVFRVWGKLAPTLVQTRYDGRPGVFTQASKDVDGRLTVLLASLRYREDAPSQVTVHLPGVPPSAQVTEYVIDDQHSNAYDAGPDHAELETIPASSLALERIAVELRPRSVHLLVIDPI
jgi:hypothetical protein